MGNLRSPGRVPFSEEEVERRMLRITNRLVLAVALCSLTAAAQGQWMRGMRGTPPDPQAMVRMRVELLAGRLSLTDAQKSTATTIFTAAQAASQNIQTALQEARKTLLGAIRNNDITGIETQAATIGALTGQVTAIDGKAQAAFYAILTADQQAKYDSMPPGGPGGPGGPMGPRGFGVPPAGGPGR